MSATQPSGSWRTSARCVSLGIRDESAPLQSMMDCSASLQHNLALVLLYLGRSIGVHM